MLTHFHHTTTAATNLAKQRKRWEGCMLIWPFWNHKWYHKILPSLERMETSPWKSSAQSIAILCPFFGGGVCVRFCLPKYPLDPFSTISSTEKRGYSYSSSLFIGLLRTKKLIRLASFALAGGVSFLIISLDSNKVNQTQVFLMKEL